MSPKLALLLCTTFVLYLLRLDRKKAPEVSYVLWIPTIWMLSVASKPLSNWFLTPGLTRESGSPVDRLFLTGLLGIGLYILARRKFNWSSAIKENIWLILLLAYMFVSIFWSNIPFISFKRWTRELIAVVMAFLLLTEPSPRKAFESLIRRSIYILIPFSLLLIRYFPEYGRHYDRWSGGQTWIGVTNQKNGLGRLCLISGFFLVWSLIKRWQGHDTSAVKYQNYAEIFLLILTLWLLKGPSNAYSATAIGALMVGLTVFGVLLWMKRRQINFYTPPFTAMVAVGIIFGILTVFAGGSTVGVLTSSFGRDATLTGRTEVWAELLPVALQRPILGHGVGGFWTSTAREVYDINEAHSGYLDVLLNIGFVGLFLFSMFLLSSCRKAQRELNDDFDWAILIICFLLMAVIHNITESSFNSLTAQMTAVLLFLAVSSQTSISSSQENP